MASITANMKENNRCAIYARYFSSAQKDESIEQQIESCKDYAKRNGIHIVAIYADHPMSGRNGCRPAWGAD